MFGLEGQNQKKKDPKDVLFELENELGDRRKRTEIHKKVEGRIQNIKNILRSGENKEEFDQFGALLHGYTSLLKVINRYPQPKG